jgi:thymidylate synthase ThyX
VYEAKILADSVSPAGVRLTTLQITFPRIILAELSRHRMFSLSVASSRAIPVKKRIEAVINDPFIPEEFGRNQKGMQAGEMLPLSVGQQAAEIWKQQLVSATYTARTLDLLNVHKQWANRVLEPFSWCTAVITATEFNNFFHLRCHPDAQPEFQKLAGMMRDVMEASTPQTVVSPDWHLPYTDPHAWFVPGNKHAALVSAARCARVSYLNHQPG